MYGLSYESHRKVYAVAAFSLDAKKAFDYGRVEFFLYILCFRKVLVEELFN